MDNLGCANGVQQKLPCIFKIAVTNAQSSKRSGQTYKVVATKAISPEVLTSKTTNACATEKLDGTCCYINNYEGQLILLMAFLKCYWYFIHKIYHC